MRAGVEHRPPPLLAVARELGVVLLARAIPAVIRPRPRQPASLGATMMNQLGFVDG
jgi:hypothetical protein